MILQYTGNYNLKKPDGSDIVNIDDLNSNMDILDTEVAKKVDKVDGKGLSDENYTLAEKNKLAGIESGAQKNKVNSVNGKTGAVTVTKSDVGLGNVSNDKQATKVEFDEHLADYVHHAGYGTASGTNDKTITLNPAPSGYKEGMTVAFKNVTQNTGAVTLNVNGKGAKPVLKSNGSALSSGNLKAGSIYTVRYNGSNFILQGEGGEYGTAQTKHVLSPYTIGTEEGIKTGTMPNRGAPAHTLTTQGGQYNIPAGYYSGGYVKAQFANLTPENIKEGVNVGGVVGTLTPAPTNITTTTITKSGTKEVVGYSEDFFVAPDDWTQIMFVSNTVKFSETSHNRMISSSTAKSTDGYNATVYFRLFGVSVLSNSAVYGISIAAINILRTSTTTYKYYVFGAEGADNMWKTGTGTIGTNTRVYYQFTGPGFEYGGVVPWSFSGTWMVS